VNRTAAGRYARQLVRIAASRGRLGETILALRNAASFFESEDGRDARACLQSSRVPAAEREALLVELASALGLTDEARATVAAFARMRALGEFWAVARRAEAQADAEADPQRVEVRTARPVAPEALARVAAGIERMLGCKARLEVVEDADLMAGLVARAGNHVWDGSLAGKLARMREKVSGET